MLLRPVLAITAIEVDIDRSRYIFEALFIITRLTTRPFVGD
jgi:hypothetical protein